jgi:AhpD family alkylhydroperoxidase
MLGLEKYLHASGLEEGLIHLIKLRASQINGCAYCIDMHSSMITKRGSGSGSEETSEPPQRGGQADAHSRDLGLQRSGHPTPAPLLSEAADSPWRQGPRACVMVLLDAPPASTMISAS